MSGNGANRAGGNCWRTTGDINDSWGSLANIGFHQNGHEVYAGPGHWNDPDMLIVGYVGWARTCIRRISRPMSNTRISVCGACLCSPLLIGCDMTRLDDFTKSLLTNDEVLALDQDSLGKQASRISDQHDTQVWAKDLDDGSKAAGLFNLDDDPQEVKLSFADLKVNGPQRVRDLWRQKDLGEMNDGYSVTVPGHGVVLVKVSGK